MPVEIGNNQITFPDGTVQSTAYSSATDQGQLISVTTYTSGTNTYTVPANCTYVWVKVQGGGGGSAGYCESGGAGGYAEGKFDVTAGANVTVTVGAGGAGVSYYAAASGGSTSSFGSYLSATGGSGANSQYSHTGGSGGVGAGGDINLLGGGGTGHANHHGYGGVGRGGQGYYGGGNGVRHYYNQFVPGTAPGAGASGAQTDGGPNGNYGTTGGTGLVQIFAYT